MIFFKQIKYLMLLMLFFTAFIQGAAKLSLSRQFDDIETAGVNEDKRKKDIEDYYEQIRLKEQHQKTSGKLLSDFGEIKSVQKSPIGGVKSTVGAAKISPENLYASCQDTWAKAKTEGDVKDYYESFLKLREYKEASSKSLVGRKKKLNIEECKKYFAKKDLNRIKSFHRGYKILNGLKLALDLNDEKIVNYFLDCDKKREQAKDKSQTQINTDFLKAVRAGNVEKAEDLLDAGADLFAETEDGWTALMIAVLSNLDMMAFILNILEDLKLLDVDFDGYFFKKNRQSEDVFALSAKHYSVIFMLLMPYWKKYDIYNNCKYNDLLIRGHIKRHFKFKIKFKDNKELVEILKKEKQKIDDLESKKSKKINELIYGKSYRADDLENERTAIIELIDEIEKKSTLKINQKQMTSQFHKDMYFLYYVYNFDLAGINFTIQKGANPKAKLLDQNAIMIFLEEVFRKTYSFDDNYALLKILVYIIKLWPEGVNECNGMKLTPLYLVVNNLKNFETCKTLQARSDKKFSTLLFLDALLQFGANPKIIGPSEKPVLMECFLNLNEMNEVFGEREFMLLLRLIEGSDVNYCHPTEGTIFQTAIMRCISTYDITFLSNIINCLIENGANIYTKYHCDKKNCRDRCAHLNGKRLIDILNNNNDKCKFLRQFILEKHEKYLKKNAEYLKKLCEHVYNIEKLKIERKAGQVDPRSIICRYLTTDQQILSSFSRYLSAGNQSSLFPVMSPEENKIENKALTDITKETKEKEKEEKTKNRSEKIKKRRIEIAAKEESKLEKQEDMNEEVDEDLANVYDSIPEYFNDSEKSDDEEEDI